MSLTMMYNTFQVNPLKLQIEILVPFWFLPGAFQLIPVHSLALRLPIPIQSFLFGLHVFVWVCVARDKKENKFRHMR